MLKLSFSYLILIGFIWAGDYWQQFVQYTMDVRLEPEKHLVKGQSRILYLNNSPNDLDRIYLHLYPKAFQRGSVKHREYLQSFGRLQRAKRFIQSSKTLWNQFEVNNFQIFQSSGATTNTYNIDDTILESHLPEILLSGDSLVIVIEWTHIVGEQFERAGYINEQYNMAQWYPKLVVYDEKGWHPDPFHAEGEFYGEFGTFNVTLDLPGDYVVGATGVVTSGDPGWKQVEVDTSMDFKEWLKGYQESKTESDSVARRIVSFHAEQVHDFAWIASPTFLYEHGSWYGIDVHVLFNESNGEEWSKKVRERSERALDWLSTKFGMYTYPQVTVADRIKSGGMEYPMLVMNGRANEGLIVHEIGHIWFYGILGNNEVDDAWLDEGFTSFQTNWYMETRYPQGIDFKGTRYKPYQQKHWRFASRTEKDQWSSIRLIHSGFDEPISRSSYLFNGGSVYRQNAYTKPALMLDELKYLLGDSLFLKCMQTYFERWKLKHVNEQRFISIIEAVSGQKLDWFFASWLHDTQSLDYGIRKWQKEKQSDSTWLVTLDLVKYGQRNLPLDIETKLSNGSSHFIRWNNHLWRFEDRFQYIVPSKPTSVILDPQVQTLDMDYRNNVTGRLKREWIFDWPGMTYNPRDRYVVRWSPLVYYHRKDGVMPGIRLARKYGDWEQTNITLNYALDSNQLYWSLSSRQKPVRNRTGAYLDFFVYDQGGVTGYGSSIHHDWSSIYRIPPYHNISAGFYVTNSKDTTRTNLYDPGVVTVLYGKYNLSVMENTIAFEISSAPKSWSDWSFSRVSSTINIELATGEAGIRDRFIAGFMWSDTIGIPAQERYTIEGAGSGDLFSKHYLRDESSLFGLEDLRPHYHLAGDANLRGYYDQGYVGVERIVANSLEFFHKYRTSILAGEIVGFVDGGIFWGSRKELNDKGLKGDVLWDAGIGIRLNKSILGKDIYLRIDWPFWISEPGPDEDVIDFSRWVFGFQTGI